MLTAVCGSVRCAQIYSQEWTWLIWCLQVHVIIHFDILLHIKSGKCQEWSELCIYVQTSTILDTLVHQSRSQHCMHYCVTSTCRRLTFSPLLLIQHPSSASSTWLTQTLSPQLGLHRHHQQPVHQRRFPLRQHCYLPLCALHWIVHLQWVLHTIHGYVYTGLVSH